MQITCCLRLASLKKVPLLESTDEKVLKAICEYLTPVTYGEDVYIIRKGEPLRKMFFITRGTALTYTTIKRTGWCGDRGKRFASFGTSGFADKAEETSLKGSPRSSESFSFGMFAGLKSDEHWVA
ncbi:hypothetical protein L3X38_024705 [Prunus dulcis]|uniref:Cyclic nucleotide-binding domain-containing protein n=1 Tax=Prunus dulcis TaxID=3755 RepID=A0AAD4W292_PRUDU|nr:hypothetical protein L3X38_024705 [Prunus dulcis]